MTPTKVSYYINSASVALNILKLEEFFFQWMWARLEAFCCAPEGNKIFGHGILKRRDYSPSAQRTGFWLLSRNRGKIGLIIVRRLLPRRKTFGPSSRNAKYHQKSAVHSGTSHSALSWPVTSATIGIWHRQVLAWFAARRILGGTRRLCVLYCDPNSLRKLTTEQSEACHREAWAKVNLLHHT
jgi:hypothetical protein